MAAGLLRDLKLTQKIFFIFVVMIFLVINSWAFTFTTILDFQNSFRTVKQYSFPSILLTSELKDHVHTALLSVYNYVSTGDQASKTTYQTEFNAAIRSEYNLFQLSQTTTDFNFTQQFNDKLLAIYNKADELVAIYEADATDPKVKQVLTDLNTLRDTFNQFLQSEVTNQISSQIDTANTSITDTVNTIQLYLIGVGILVVLVIIYVAVFISTNITKPVRALTKAAQQFGQGKFQPVTVQRNDELGLFAQTFNTMAENIQATQTALREELAKTKELDRQKSEFLSIAAHQLRTPMAGIRWASQMLYDGDMGEMNTEQKHHLGNALENINRMISLINDLLDVTKIEEQRFNYKFAEHDIVMVMTEQINILAQLAKSSNVTVQLTSEPAGPIRIECDKEKINLAFTNLIDNAIKYSHSGGTVEIHLQQTSTGVDGYVRDHGLGIPQKSQAEVFTKFFRGPNVLKVITEGSGLGLFLVKDTITKHDGTVRFESIEGQGTTFFFHLPAKQVQITQPTTGVGVSSSQSA